jgi:putative NIF3 family GTP cyclohydrolase 1 type 2
VSRICISWPRLTKSTEANDLTTPVLDEALADPAVGVIISYHPPLFRSIKRLTLADPKQAIALRCATAGVSVFSPHTALDNCMDGGKILIETHGNSIMD